jgi:lipopolysaccharide export system permease protein
VKFSQLNIDLKDLKTSTIKNPKLQETFTLDLIRCIFGSGKIDILNCKEHTKNEIITNLNRRLVLPLYIPVIALMCSFLLIKTRTKNNYFLNKNTIFIFSFLILLYAELIIRYTGVSRLIGSLFLVSPILLMPIIYVTLMFKLSNESLKK